MRIACPACNAAFQVPDDQLSEGRVVRCARCGTDWTPIGSIPAGKSEEAVPESVAVPPVVDAPEPDALVAPQRVAAEEIPLPLPFMDPEPPARPTREAPGPALLVLAWVVSLAIVGTAIGGLYAGRERVMQVWPPSARAYAALGLGGREAGSERRQ